MIKIENTEVLGWEHAIRGMRNPMNSWDKSDSKKCDVIYTLSNENHSYRCAGCKNEDIGRPNCIVIGPEDHALMMKLCKTGTDHRKYMRMITVYMDVTAPLYWWKEFDTYKVGTVANSCSTMHKIHEKEFCLDDFSHEHLRTDKSDFLNATQTPFSALNMLEDSIYILNRYRDKYIETKDKQYWWQMIQLLPSSYNQKRTIMLNYEVLANIYKSRKNHKLDEWVEFCEWIKSLPYSELIIGHEYEG